MHRTEHLKIKLCTLAAEARLIRAAENRRLRSAARARARGADDAPQFAAYRSLRDHRCGVVRRHARANHLALGFLRGRSYAEMEARTAGAPDWVAVRKAAETFASPWDSAGWSAWLDAAERHLRAGALLAA